MRIKFRSLPFACKGPTSFGREILTGVVCKRRQNQKALVAAIDGFAAQAVGAIATPVKAVDHPAAVYSSGADVIARVVIDEALSGRLYMPCSFGNISRFEGRCAVTGVAK
jgi:hypothetical protein